MRIDLTWTEFKNICLTEKELKLQYKLITKSTLTYYLIWATEEYTDYICAITKTSPASSDQQDFENNYITIANKSLRLLSDDGKEIVRAESRPLETTTCFTGRGDSATNIGDGKVISWDFSNSDDDITPSGVNYKRKRLEFKFIDSVWVKEGTIYYHNVVKGSYLDLYVVCPSGQYYYDNDGDLQLATEDTPISHYVIYHPLQGTVAMGDKLNTESCSSEIPNNYKFWLEVTVPDTDDTSSGHVEVEIYRKRTVVL